MLFVCLPPAEHEGPCPMYAHKWWSLREYPDEECWEMEVSNFGRGVVLTSCLPFSRQPLRDQKATRDVCTSRFDLVGIYANLSNHWWPLAPEVFTYKQENTTTVTLGWFWDVLSLFFFSFSFFIQMGSFNCVKGFAGIYNTCLLVESSLEKLKAYGLLCNFFLIQHTGRAYISFCHQLFQVRGCSQHCSATYTLFLY